MERDISSISQEPYDLLIIGGGINGAAIANMAALNGLKTILLEKNDFASGTSSKSTKLIHGGLRYLENADFGLVREALKERHIQIKNAPHLVKPLSFIIPVYENDHRPLWLMKLGVFLYDAISGKYLVDQHRSLEKQEVINSIPGIKEDGLKGGVLYYDAQMDDARLCLENILSAYEKGAQIFNYTEANELIEENGKAIGVKATDSIARKEFEVHAKKIVTAVGPWTNLFREKDHSQQRQKIRTTKGAHIVYKDKISEHALIVPAKSDNRIFFMIPWKGNTLIGTTDTDYNGNPDNVGVEVEDIDYLIKESKRIFPDRAFSQKNIITTFAGLRPLVSKRGSPSKLSRKHVLEESSSGILYVLGGKYTTYRKIAEDVIKRVVKKEIVNTQREYPLYGSGTIKENMADLSLLYGLDSETMEMLINLYGVHYKDVLAPSVEKSALKEYICTCSKTIAAQVVYAIKVEMALKEEDIIQRRLSLDHYDCPTGRCRKEVSKILGSK